MENPLKNWKRANVTAAQCFFFVFRYAALCPPPPATPYQPSFSPR